MNKILTLLIAVVIIYQSFAPLLKMLFKQRVKRKEYRPDFGKKFNHLFAATLLLIIPLLCLVSYFELLPSLGKISLAVFAAICGLAALVCFYLYKNYTKSIPYSSLIYDPNQATIELLSFGGREIIPLTYVRGIEWYSIKNWLKLMPWSNFEYLALEMKNGRKLIIPSVIMAPTQLQNLLAKFEVIHIKKFFPSIK
jgi:hypothetical protein